MKMTLEESIRMIMRGETPEQYAARIRKIKRYARERDDLEDALSVLTLPQDAERRAKKEKRLAAVKGIIEGLK